MADPMTFNSQPSQLNLDPLAQAFAQQWNGGLAQQPGMTPSFGFGQYKANQLGAAPTLGNQDAQDQYRQLAEAFVMQQRAGQDQDLAASMMKPRYIDNSGALGVAAMMMEAYAGKKMAERADKKDIESRERYYRGEAAAEEAKARREATKEAEKTAKRMEIIRRGDQAEMLANGIELPKPESGYDVRQVNGKLFYVPKSPTQNQPVRHSQNSPAADAGFDMLRDAVKWRESRGNPNAVSPKGARGTMQTMPGTLRDPGYGVAAAKDDSPEELERVGTDYLQAMVGKYGTTGGLAAYNWGPGNWEKALQASGGDSERALAMAPKETREYVPSVLQRAQGGVGIGWGVGQSEQAQVSPKAQEAQRRRDLAELVASGVPITNGMANAYMKDGQFPEIAGAIPVPGLPDQRDFGDAPSGYRWKGDGTQEPVPGGPADRKNNPMPSDMAKGEMGMRKEVQDRVQQDRSILNMYRNIEGAMRDATAAGDLSATFAYMKMLDPGSVVREQEFANAQNAAGIPDRIRNLYNQALKGTRLNPTQRKEFMAEAKKLADAAQDRITGVAREYQGIAEQYGYDPTRATGMPDFRNVTSRPNAAANSGVDDLLTKYGVK